MNSLIILKSAQDMFREQLQAEADALIEKFRTKEQDKEYAKEVAKCLAEVPEGEKITPLRRGDKLTKVIDNLDARHAAGEDRKIISLPF